MTLLVMLVALVAVLTLATELATNWRDQWVPRYQRRFGGQASPGGIVFVVAVTTIVAIVAAAVAFGAGWLLGGAPWASAWATLVLIVVALWSVHNLYDVISDGRKYVHPKNPKSPFWP
jgi:hypothetical protein